VIFFCLLNPTYPTQQDVSKNVPVSGTRFTYNAFFCFEQVPRNRTGTLKHPLDRFGVNESAIINMVNHPNRGRGRRTGSRGQHMHRAKTCGMPRGTLSGSDRFFPKDVVGHYTMLDDGRIIMVVSVYLWPILL
jgi:hypothetical protein